MSSSTPPVRQFTIQSLLLLTAAVALAVLPISYLGSRGIALSIGWISFIGFQLMSKRMLLFCLLGVGGACLIAMIFLVRADQ